MAPLGGFLWSATFEITPLTADRGTSGTEETSQTVLQQWHPVTVPLLNSAAS